MQIRTDSPARAERRLISQTKRSIYIFVYNREAVVVSMRARLDRVGGGTKAPGKKKTEDGKLYRRVSKKRRAQLFGQIPRGDRLLHLQAYLYKVFAMRDSRNGRQV